MGYFLSLGEGSGAVMVRKEEVTEPSILENNELLRLLMCEHVERTWHFVDYDTLCQTALEL